MQEVTLWFWAALSVVLIVTSFVDSQEVFLVAETDINPVGQVRKSLIFIGLHSNCIKFFRVQKCATGSNVQQEADVIRSENRF
jgi:hypothetical protein